MAETYQRMLANKLELEVPVEKELLARLARRDYIRSL